MATKKHEDLSNEAGVRISPPHEHDGERTYFEMFLKKTGKVVSRGPSFTDFNFTIRGKERRRSPRCLENERRAISTNNSNYYDGTVFAVLRHEAK